MVRDTHKTLHWIVALLRGRDVPFVLSGGFAARCYGATRPLNDIDIDIPDRFIPVIAGMVAPWIVSGPERYRDGKWDLELMTLMHEGQEIDIGGGDSLRISTPARDRWVDMPVDFTTAVMMDVAGISVPVVAPDFLIAYKSLLDGEHQQGDIAAARAYMTARGL